MQLRQTLQAGQLIQHKPGGTGSWLSLIHQPQHQSVQPQAREGHEPRARLRRAGEKQPARRGLRPLGGAPSAGRVTFGGQELERVRHHIERREHAAALVRRLPVDHRGIRRPGQSPVDLVLVTEPPGQLFGGRFQRQQMREDASRRLGEEGILVVPVREERRRERERLGFVPPFIARTPVRTAGIERVEDEVTAFGRVEL